MSEKPTNPKDLIGSNKLPLGLVPATSIAYQSLGHLEGNLKYGLVNWREMGVRSSIYVDAAMRHLFLKWYHGGEWCDPDTRVPHLGSALACIGIIIDAYECGKLIDDRPRPVPAIEDSAHRLERVVAHLRGIHADKTPVHFTIGGPTRFEGLAQEPTPEPTESSREVSLSDGPGSAFRRG